MSMGLVSAGEYSRAIDKAAQRPREAFRFSVLGHSRALEELGEVWERCRVGDWDGYGAMPVDTDTLRVAYALIETLPLGFPRPSIGAEPDGQLTLEWHKSPTRTLSVSVDPEGLLHYAGLFGSNRRYGTMPFYSSTPDELIRLVRDL